jgi:peptidoglycan/LPS O-acetylase OafA/YrhL
MSEQRNSTNFLRVLALALVVNSHMDELYPRKLAVLATGGMMGNALFFMLSSLGLILSMQARQRSFGEWYGRRITRIYPSVWVIVILLTFPLDIYRGATHLGNVLDQMNKFFYPPFWFLEALMIYYVFVFFIINHYSDRRLAWVASLVVAIYVLYYVFLLDLTKFSIEGTPFRLIFYFLVVLWGIFLGSRGEKIQYKGPQDVLFLLLSIACIYAHKFLMLHGRYDSFQFVQHLAAFPMLYYFLKVAKSNFISHTIMGGRYLGATLTFVSAATLEVFMVNNTIDFLGPKLGSFPVNVISLLVLNLGLALLIFYCAKPISRIFGSGSREEVAVAAR